MSTQDYVSIRISTLRGDLKIPFDAYVKINQKFIVFCRKGDSFEGSRLERLRSKKLKKMFILPDQESMYRKYMKDSIDAAYSSDSGKSLEVRAQIIQGSQQANAEEVMENVSDEKTYQEAKESSQKFVEFLLKENNALNAILNVENQDQSVAHHGVNVATLAVSLTKVLKIKETDPQMLGTFALGCLLHDIEHLFTQTDLSIPTSQLNDAQLLAYKNHASAGAERVRVLKHFDQMVIRVIAQHEERINGSGYPNALTGKDLDPWIQIAALANLYDKTTVFEKKAPKDAIKHLMLNELGRHDLHFLKALQTLV